MKKSILSVSVIFFLAFSSCSLLTNDDDGGTSIIEKILGLDDVKTTESASWNYSTTNNVFYVDENVQSLSISGNLGNKNIYYAEVNTSNYDITTEYIKYIKSVTARNIVELEEEQIFEGAEIQNEDDLKHLQMYDWKPTLSESTEDSAARTIDHHVTSKNTPVTQLSYEVGVTKKTVWTVKTENKTDIYEAKKATLWAYNDTCNVWIVDSDAYITGDSAKKTKAELFASAFEKIYPAIRNIFGSESDNIYYNCENEVWTTAPMNYLSDTDIKVNIVVYDLYADGKDGNVLGFFTPMDYYPSSADFMKIQNTSELIDSYSNEGKYFYIDSYHAINAPNKIISTIAHEFQHMINFAQKTMKGKSIDINFNEMLSMLCEDMMQQFLTSNGYPTTDSNSPKGRFPGFMIQYHGVGIRGSDNTSVYYANAYAFGSWLCRQYGGAALVKKMMSNGLTDNDCIVSAVNSLNNTHFTFNDLFSQFIKACFGDSTYTFNQDAAQTVNYKNSYYYPMNAIDFWDSSSIYNLSKIKIPDSDQTYKDFFAASVGKYLDSNYNYFGPAIYKSNTFMKKIPANYGIVLKRLGSISSGASSCTLSFTTKSGYTKKGMKLLLFIK